MSLRRKNKIKHVLLISRGNWSCTRLMSNYVSAAPHQLPALAYASSLAIGGPLLPRGHRRARNSGFLSPALSWLWPDRWLAPPVTGLLMTSSTNRGHFDPSKTTTLCSGQPWAQMPVFRLKVRQVIGNPPRSTGNIIDPAAPAESSGRERQVRSGFFFSPTSR